mmetsp:Transcript_767/g.2146  ORF Transcript_767/g.2146 Transcript_767/m.2146 type:complete len:461 (-) Transcript_767:72-1454(-)
MPDKVSASFRQTVAKVTAWIRANGRVPCQQKGGEEQAWASFLNTQQQWISGRSRIAKRGARKYPVAQMRLLQRVPKLGDKLRAWAALKARRIAAAAVMARGKPLDAKGRRQQLEHVFGEEAKHLAAFARRTGRLPSESGTGQAGRSAAFLTTVLQGLRGSSTAYPPALQSLLLEVLVLKKCLSSAASKRCRQQGYCCPNTKRQRQECDKALVALQVARFPVQSTRLNVTVDDGANADALPSGLSLGMNLSLRHGWTVSRTAMERHGELVRALCRLIREVNPNFQFTSIQVNKNFSTALHCDANNLGPSVITCLGAFTGGALYVHGRGEVDVKERFYEFNGNVPHLTCPFKGERFCVIYFSNQSYAKLPAKDATYLKKLGFNWPSPGRSKEDYGPRAPRLLAAAAALPPALADRAGPISRMCKGGTGTKWLSEAARNAKAAGNAKAPRKNRHTLATTKRRR